MTQRNLVVGGLVVAAVGVLLPWVTAGFISATGLDTGDGKLFGGMVLLAAVLVALWFRKPRSAIGILAFIVTGLMAVLAIYEVIHISTIHGPFGITASPGTGLIIDALAAIVTTVVMWRLLRPKVR